KTAASRATPVRSCSRRVSGCSRARANPAPKTTSGSERRNVMDKRATLTVMSLLALAAAPAAAQSGGREHAEHESSPPTPRFEDGLVDFGGDGIWMQPWITDFGAQLVGRDDIPFLPWTKAMYDYNKSNQVAYDPQGFCLPPGGPRSMGTPYP